MLIQPIVLRMCMQIPVSRHVCMRMYICVHTVFSYIWVSCTRVCMCTHIFGVYVYVNIGISVYGNIDISVYLCMEISISTYIRKYRYLRIYVNIDIYVYVSVYGVLILSFVWWYPCDTRTCDVTITGTLSKLPLYVPLSLVPPQNTQCPSLPQQHTFLLWPRSTQNAVRHQHLPVQYN